MKKFKKLTPFKLQVLENFPFIDEDFDAITNYELLCKVVEYLNNTMENVNIVEDDVDKLKEQFTELKSYVDNYFDNLDLQTEVNNKLDEMAESGELEQIISEYLRLTGIFAFDTISDMKLSENLTNGAITKTLGRNSYNDGYGAFYKVRNLNISDIVDDYNIVSLYNGELVAEMIPNSNSGIINDNILNNTLKINNIKGRIKLNDKLFLGAFFNPNEGNKIYLKVSKDGKNFNTLSATNLTGRDPSIAYINGNFYIVVTNYSNDFDFIIYKSSDLITWTTHYINANLNNYYSRWAPEFFVDGDTIKIIITLQETASSNFYIYTLDCTNLENLTFGNLTNITPSNESSCIDGSITKFENTYYMVVTDTTQSSNDIQTSRIYTSNDLTTWALLNDNIFKTCYNVEGCQLLRTNNQWTIYGDSPLLAPYLCLETPNLAITDSEGNNIKNYIQPIYSLTDMRHGTILLCEDEEIQEKVYNLIDTNNVDINYIVNPNKVTNLIELTNAHLDKIIIQPNTLIHVGGADSTVGKVYNPLRCERFGIIFYASVDYGQVTFNQLQNIQGSMVTVNRNYHNSNGIAAKVFYQELNLNCNATYIP